MNFWRSALGMVDVKIISADPPGALEILRKSHVRIYNARSVDPLTMEIQIYRTDWRKVRHKLKMRGNQIRLINRSGFYWKFKGLLKRPLLLAGLIFFLIAMLYLPSRIFFIRVEGNERIPAALIVERANQCGVGFGVSRREVRSEKVKNELLGAIPELQWAGVNTSGCIATISVREKTLIQENREDMTVASIVATRDGVVQSCTVIRGTALCSPGQVVRAGQILISGYTDCGMFIQATRADGEVFAETERELTVLSPTNFEKQTGETASVKKYSLLIGKKRINFYKGSGISDSSCGKMYVEKYLTLPGGFRLPIAIAWEEWTYQETVSQRRGEELAQVMAAYATDYLCRQMVAGQILFQELEVTEKDDFFLLTGKYGCLEMIGHIRREEIGDLHG